MYPKFDVRFLPIECRNCVRPILTTPQSCGYGGAKVGRGRREMEAYSTFRVWVAGKSAEVDFDK